MRWCKRGVREKALDEIDALHRQKKGRKSSLTYVIIDSQGVKTVSGGESRGYDGEKKVKGRKRHIGVDTEGHLLHVEVTAANEHDTRWAVTSSKR